MAGNTGTLELADLLAQTYVSAEAYGVNTIIEVATRDLAAYNTIWRDPMQSYVAITTDAQRVSGGSSQGRMQRVGQVGRAPTQVAGAGGTVGFPLDRYQFNIGWTNDFAELMTPADMARQTLNAQGAHARALLATFQRAIYGSANYPYYDELSKNIQLTVRRFANADGQAIANGPNGESFDGTVHNHYLANTTLSSGLLTALVQTVQEHNASARVQLCVNISDAPAVQALTGFDPLIYAGFSTPTTISAPTGDRPIGLVNNVKIGMFNKVAEVWIKPWALPNYPVALDLNAPESPVVLREQRAGASDLNVKGQFQHFPITAEYMQSTFGMGVWGRLRGAVSYVGPQVGGQSLYVDPVILD